MTSRAIFVLGPHRSGTSAVTRVLNLHGVPLGEELLPPASDNEGGFWEHVAVVMLHERLLSALGRRWDDVAALPEGWLRSPAADIARAEIRGLIAREFAGQAIWAVKDPRLCRFMPLWLGVLGELRIEPVCLFVARHPEEVAASLAKREGLSIGWARLTWMQYLVEAESATRGLRRAMVAYDDVLRDWQPVLARAFEELDIAPPIASDVCRAAVDAYLDAGRRHHRAPAAPADPLIAAVYAASIADGRGDWAALAERGAEYLRMAALFEPALNDLTERDRANAALIEQLRDPGVDPSGLRARVGALEAVIGHGEGLSHLPLIARRLLPRPADTAVGLHARERCQLYYRGDDENYDETRSFAQDVVLDAGPVRVEFVLDIDARAWTRVRFDPAVLGGLFRIRAIDLDGHALDPAVAITRAHGELLQPGSGAGVLLWMPHADPGIEIDLHGAVPLARSGQAARLGFVIERITLQSAITEELSTQVQAVLEQRAVHDERRLKALEDDLRQLRAQLDERSTAPPSERR